MSVLIDTATVPEGERFDFWSESILRVFEPMGVRRVPSSPPTFSGHVRGYTLGPLRIFRVRVAPAAVHRTPATIAAADPETFHLAMALRGRTAVSQGDRTAVVEPGYVAGYESSRPYLVENVEPLDFATFVLPRHLLEPHADRACRQSALRIGGADGRGGLIVPFLRSLVLGLERGAIDEHERATLAESVVGLFRTLYAPEASAGRNSAPDALLGRIKDYVEAHLGDVGLSPPTLAREHFISLRYLHRLFEREGTTVARFIRDRRLERCRRDLQDPALADRTVLAIATRWGLDSPASFSRAFRRAFGLAPSELRAAALGRRRD